MTKMTRIAVGSLMVAGLAFTTANAAEIKLKATLNGASEVPANTTTGKGTAELTLNDATKEISWTISYEGLTGDAVAAHIHGPAAATANAGVVTSLVPMGTAPKSPLVGKATLTAEQMASVLAGMTYVNVHTAANKGGEIRGQISK